MFYVFLKLSPLLTVCIVVHFSQIQNVSSRRERVFIESRQLKICATCFDLALALLRVLEMVASIAPEIFTDVTRRSSEPLLARLCQVCISFQ
jgi:Kip1 ubiquitination-promoting complex protein 1